ncbi:MAG: indole-3-glycerol phosphate synthase TrpC [Haliscomenobacter sp.]|nr:indole-3-glycerol phosphate synthase TrpC [Haliscomenobacter sp.]MBK9489967.1 indole-3-glycerol phosphate synthase TrpC [Haliscomenobacter sp.]
MNILDKIVAHKHIEIAERSAMTPISVLEKSPYFGRQTYSLRTSLLHPERTGIIAEFKRRSPSKGDINTRADAATVTKGYADAGASGLSILTDEQFFGGSTADLIAGREANQIPVLRKDFMVHDYQVFEARAMGADAILLIAECLEADQLRSLAKTAKSLGLEVLMEIHSGDQLAKLCPEIDVVGVNNRNLKNFEVSVQTSIDLFDQIPAEFLKISESGINNPQTIHELKQVGFQGFLIGEYFMSDPQPQQRFVEFVQSLNAIESQTI